MLASWIRQGKKAMLAKLSRLAAARGAISVRKDLISLRSRYSFGKTSNARYH
jgi:hypothetical protein